jgi:peroxiredoxin Q/BCP
MLTQNQTAPLDITLTDENNASVSLRDHLGSYVVLYFYPKDDTPGCTVEACSFRDAHQELLANNVTVIGVSKDAPRSHQKFKTKHSLPFPLWADEEHKLAEAFGVWQEKKFMGRTYMGMTRSTFVIDPHGVIVKVWETVNPVNHSQEVIVFLSSYMRQ